MSFQLRYLSMNSIKEMANTDFKSFNKYIESADAFIINPDCEEFVAKYSKSTEKERKFIYEKLKNEK